MREEDPELHNNCHFPPCWYWLCQVNLNKWGGAKTVWHYDSGHYDSLSLSYKGILSVLSVSLCLSDITKHKTGLSVLLINTSLWWHSCAPSLSSLPLSLSCPVMYIIISKHNLVLVLVIVNTKSKAGLAFSQLCSFQVLKIKFFLVKTKKFQF